MVVRVLVDVRSRLFADALAMALRSAGANVTLAGTDLLHDDSAFDLAVVDGSVRLAAPARFTVRVDRQRADDLELLMDLVELASGQRQTGMAPQPSS